MTKFLIIHTLRNYAVSNLNRGDDGAPKHVYFGGERRGRISSQSIKRAIRMSSAFDDFRARGQMDIRTRQLPSLLVDELAALGLSGGDLTSIVERIHELGRNKEEGSKAKREGQTNQLILLSVRGAHQLARQLFTASSQPAWNTNTLENIGLRLTEVGVDTALFGSMTTSSVFPRVDGACMASHALSTNRTYKAIDYFTAVDDLTLESGLVGEAEFNSNCYYWTLTVDMDQLLKNLGDDKDLRQDVLVSLLNGIVVANPTGKQNTLASHPFPAFILVEKREGVVFDYADAFVKPVEPTRRSERDGEKLEATDLISESVRAISEHIDWCDTTYGYPADRLYLARTQDSLTCKRAQSMMEMIQWATH